MTQASHDPGGPVHPDAPALSPRDRRILAYLAEGRSTAGIAAALSVTGNTARTGIRRLQRKLDVTDRTAAVHAAQQLGLLARPTLCSCS